MLNDRARSALSKACPPRPDAEPVAPRPRKPLNRVSPRKIERGEASAGQSTLKQSAGTRKKRPAGAREWREACLRANVEMYGVPTCEATGQLLLSNWTCHHVIEVSSLNAMGLGGSAFVIWNESNGMCLNAKPHMDHHNWSPRITADRLRSWHWDFARLLDDTQGTEWASLQLARDYPEEVR